jgi:hypothetical protein
MKDAHDSLSDDSLDLSDSPDFEKKSKGTQVNIGSSSSITLDSDNLPEEDLEDDSLFLSSDEPEPFSPPRVPKSPFKPARTVTQKKSRPVAREKVTEKASPQKKLRTGDLHTQKKSPRHGKIQPEPTLSDADDFDLDSLESHASSALSDASWLRPRPIPPIPSPRRQDDSSMHSVNDFDVYSLGVASDSDEGGQWFRCDFDSIPQMELTGEVEIIGNLKFEV